jgi:DNA mismatch repair protein MutL
LYERYLKQGQQTKTQYSISLIFPISWEVDTVEKMALEQHARELEEFGFQFVMNDERVQLKGIPGDWNLSGAEQEFKQILRSLIEEEHIQVDRRLCFARTLAQASVRMKSTHWNESEIRTLVTQLIACDAPDVCPEGKICFWKLTYNEIEKRLNL